MIDLILFCIIVDCTCIRDSKMDIAMYSGKYAILHQLFFQPGDNPGYYDAGSHMHFALSALMDAAFYMQLQHQDVDNFIPHTIAVHIYDYINHTTTADVKTASFIALTSNIDNANVDHVLNAFILARTTFVQQYAATYSINDAIRTTYQEIIRYFDPRQVLF